MNESDEEKPVPPGEDPEPEPLGEDDEAEGPGEDGAGSHEDPAEGGDEAPTG